MADRHEVRGFGSGERRMERRRAAAELARQQASAEDREEAQQRHLRHMLALRSEENEARNRTIENLKGQLEESVMADRKQRHFSKNTRTSWRPTDPNWVPFRRASRLHGLLRS